MRRYTVRLTGLVSGVVLYVRCQGPGRYWTSESLGPEVRKFDKRQADLECSVRLHWATYPSWRLGVFGD